MPCLHSSVFKSKQQQKIAFTLTTKIRAPASQVEVASAAIAHLSMDT